uniref:WD_REPEATS_REGION domain-containing protein n=1 Tax=Trichuris muris TaxID=70415 RepID=A0A5S6QFD3_TRIMR
MPITPTEMIGMIWYFLKSRNCPCAAQLLLFEAGMHERDMEKTDIDADTLTNLFYLGLHVLSTQDLSKVKSLLKSNTVTLKEAMEKWKKDKEVEAERRAGCGSTSDSDFSSLVPFGLYGNGETVSRILLEDHQANVFNCSWNPLVDLLATGSRGNTASFWAIEAGSALGPIVLEHPPYSVSSSQCSRQQTGVSCLAWHPSGDYIATSTFDGTIRLWSPFGVQLGILLCQRKRVVTMKWNKSGTYLVSAGFDPLVVAWESKNFTITQKFYVYAIPVTDMDWLDDEIFAICCSDMTIQVFKMGQVVLLRGMFGHTKEITMIRWHSLKSLLASSSEDGTVKIWSPDRELCVINFTDHTNEVHVVVWNPDFSSQYQLASASADKKVFLWNVDSKQCLKVLDQHDDAVMCAEFSPDGQYLASACLGQFIYLWDLQANGELVNCCWREKLDSPAFDLGWNRYGENLAVTTGTKCVIVFDLRQLRTVRLKFVPPVHQG